MVSGSGDMVGKEHLKFPRAVYMINVTKAKGSSKNAPGIEARQGVVDRVYNELRTMAMTFRFLPRERLNEVTLAKELGVSRTLIHGALNRLVTEDFLEFSAYHGFYRKTIDVKEIFDLYQFRMYLELVAVKLAVERGTDEHLSEIEYLGTESTRQAPGRTVDELVALDEQFHELLVKLTGNEAMLESLRNINARLQFVRWLDVTEHQLQAHKHIAAALRKRSRSEAERLIAEHIAHRIDEVADKVEKSFGRIFVRGMESIESDTAGTKMSVSARTP